MKPKVLTEVDFVENHSVDRFFKKQDTEVRSMHFKANPAELCVEFSDEKRGNDISFGNWEGWVRVK